MNATTNASDAYRAARERVDERLNRLNRAIREHAERQQKDPRNWGWAGDLDHARELLDELVAFLGGTDGEAVFCDRCGVEVDPAAVRVPPFCDACSGGRQ